MAHANAKDVRYKHYVLKQKVASIAKRLLVYYSTKDSQQGFTNVILHVCL